MKHYLDYNATAPVRPQVLEVMRKLQELPLNPSSVHEYGRKAKSVVNDARAIIAEKISAFPNEIIFTASGTEANNWAIRAFSERTILISAIEHPSVLKTAAAFKRMILPVTDEGIVDLDFLRSFLKNVENVIVSVMLANNETGIIQPIREIADMVHEKGGLLHCDAVQAFGKIPVSFSDLGCDLMTLSAHKMGGPVGTAALVVKSTLALQPLLTGGGQELNRRAGTENVAAIAGFAKAAELIDFEQMDKLRSWLSELENEIIKAGGRCVGKNSPRLPNTSCVTMPNISAETQVISFDLEGIAVSAGSACSSGKIEPSHVLKAMSIANEETSTAIRISGGWATKEKDVVVATNTWKKFCSRKNEKAA